MDIVWTLSASIVYGDGSGKTYTAVYDPGTSSRGVREIGDTSLLPDLKRIESYLRLLKIFDFIDEIEVQGVPPLSNMSGYAWRFMAITPQNASVYVAGSDQDVSPKVATPLLCDGTSPEFFQDTPGCAIISNNFIRVKEILLSLPSADFFNIIG
jgi:hypothetical protein